jgi:ubiquinone/menaquinone biosynthesis C-methylase UbiE
MSIKYDTEQIRQFWTEQATQHGLSPNASWSDRPVIEMEIREMSRRLRAGDRVLDVGCANGYSTVRYALDKGAVIKGLDYIPEMIEQARERLRTLPPHGAREITFDVGDIRKLDEPSSTYDAVVVTRVLINLGDEQEQAQALAECARVLKPGGTLLLSEATVQGWTKLNAFRGEWGLPPIPMPPFNRYLDERRVLEAAKGTLEVVEIANFASSYYVGTRVLKPLLGALTGRAERIADPEMHLNHWFASLPPAGDYGTQKLFVFRRL